MAIWLAIVIVVLVIAIACTPFKVDAKLWFHIMVLGFVSAVPILKYLLDISTFAAIAIAIVVVPVVAFNCIPRMSYSSAADLALKRLAQDLRMELVANGLGILEVGGIWVYNWPKVVILFESTQALEQAKENGFLDQLASRIAESVQGNPAYGRNRSFFDAKEAVLGISEQAEWDSFVAKPTYP